MEYIENFTFDELNIGDKASTERTLTEKDLILFAAVSGDVNPVHLDAEYAAKTPFKQRIAHGIWSASLISATLATVMPGPGTIYLGQSLKFLRPVLLGDRLKIEVEVAGKNDKKKGVQLNCLVTNQDGKPVVAGTADVLAPTEKTKTKRPILPEISIS
jgi:acyl dehydratase